MAKNKFIAITSGTVMGTACRMYLNISVEEAYRRFNETYPRNEDSGVFPKHIEIEFDDELHVNGVPNPYDTPNTRLFNPNAPRT